MTQNLSAHIQKQAGTISIYSLWYLNYHCTYFLFSFVCYIHIVPLYYLPSCYKQQPRFFISSPASFVHHIRSNGAETSMRRHHDYNYRPPPRRRNSIHLQLRTRYFAIISGDWFTTDFLNPQHHSREISFLTQPSQLLFRNIPSIKNKIRYSSKCYSLLFADVGSFPFFIENILVIIFFFYLSDS